MAITLSTAIRNGMAGQIEAVIGTSAVLKVRSGSAPATVADASTGTVLATMTLPSDWLGAASAGAVAKAGTWSDTSADATGTAGHVEITASDGTTVGLRGSVTVSGGGGDFIIDTVSIVAGATVTVTAATFTAGNG